MLRRFWSKEIRIVRVSGIVFAIASFISVTRIIFMITEDARRHNFHNEMNSMMAEDSNQCRDNAVTNMNDNMYRNMGMS